MKFASAPGKVILFGEHAVVYDKLGVSVAAGPERSKVSVYPSSGGYVLDSKQYGRKEKTAAEIAEDMKILESLRQRGEYKKIKEISEHDRLLAGFAVVHEVMKNYGNRVPPFEAQIDCEIPKNLGSSASVFVSLVHAVSNEFGFNMTEEEIGDMANSGDMVAHGMASGIDTHTVVKGGWNTYLKSRPPKVLPLEAELEQGILVVSSGDSAQTLDTVSYLGRLRERRKEDVDRIMERLDGISRAGMKAVLEKDAAGVGRLMYDYYGELRKVDQIEPSGEDKIEFEKPNMREIIEISRKFDGVLGAKPTGGWGGGCVIVFGDVKNLQEKFADAGFGNPFVAELDCEGVREKANPSF